MELQLFFDIIKRRILLIVIVATMTVMVVTIAGIVRTPVYEAKATIRILLDVGIEDFLRRSDFNDRLIRTYEYIMTSSPILETVRTNLSPRTDSLSVGSLRDQLIVEIVPETELIKITVSNEDPVLARDLANMFAVALMEYTRNFYSDNHSWITQLLEGDLAELEDNLNTERAKLENLSAQNGETLEIEALKTRIRNLEISQELRWRQYETARLAQNLQANSISLVQSATTPSTPANALGPNEIVLALLLGLAGGIGLALILENIDRTIRTPQQLERLTQLSVLGTVSREFLTVNKDGQISLNSKDKSLAEAYRLTGLNLQRFLDSISLSKILITSTSSGEGKSTVTANLGRIFAEQGKTVFIIEGDMRHPSLDEKFGIDNGHVGLSSLLAELSSLDQVMYPTEQATLFVIGGGPPPPNPTSLLASPAMDRVLNYLGSQGQLTLIDSPPVLGMADVSILAPKVDGVVLVVHQDLTSQEQVTRTLKQLQAVQANMIGVILVQRTRKRQEYV